MGGGESPPFMSERRREEVERRFQREENPSPKMRKGEGRKG
jgi:hypothetical protein